MCTLPCHGTANIVSILQWGPHLLFVRVQKLMLFLTNRFMIASFIMINYFAFLKKKILDIVAVDDEEVGWLVPLL